MHTHPFLCLSLLCAFYLLSGVAAGFYDFSDDEDEERDADNAAAPLQGPPTTFPHWLDLPNELRENVRKRLDYQTRFLLRKLNRHEWAAYVNALPQERIDLYDAFLGEMVRNMPGRLMPSVNDHVRLALAQIREVKYDYREAGTEWNRFQTALRYMKGLEKLRIDRSGSVLSHPWTELYEVAHDLPITDLAIPFPARVRIEKDEDFEQLRLPSKLRSLTFTIGDYEYHQDDGEDAQLAVAMIKSVPGLETLRLQMGPTPVYYRLTGADRILHRRQFERHLKILFEFLSSSAEHKIQTLSLGDLPARMTAEYQKRCITMLKQMKGLKTFHYTTDERTASFTQALAMAFPTTKDKGRLEITSSPFVALSRQIYGGGHVTKIKTPAHLPERTATKENVLKKGWHALGQKMSTRLSLRPRK